MEKEVNNNWGVKDAGNKKNPQVANNFILANLINTQSEIESFGLLELITKKIQVGFLGPQKLSIFAGTGWRFL